jgi:hypothetical protein
MYLVFGVMYVELWKFRSCTMLWQQCTDTMVDHSINFEDITRCPIVYRPINSSAEGGERKKGNCKIESGTGSVLIVHHHQIEEVYTMARVFFLYVFKFIFPPLQQRL